MMGHLNSFSASGGGNLNKNFAKNTNAPGLPGRGMLKLRFDWYIIPNYSFPFQDLDNDDFLKTMGSWVHNSEDRLSEKVN